MLFFVLVNRKFKANFINKLWERINVNSNEFNFSDVHCDMNRSGSL